jgi:CRISPR-associated protein Csd2
MSNSIKNRYDFILLFDVTDGNPNGDPDAGNLPRIDSETGQGLVTDVCLKRKVRNYIQLTKETENNDSFGFDIYVKEKSVLGRAHVEAFRKLGIDTGQESRKPIPENLISLFEDIELCEGLSVIELDDDIKALVISADTDKKEVKNWLIDADGSKEGKKLVADALKEAKPRKPTAEETERGRDWMCKHYFDIRTFGAVMSLKSAPNCGQVRGPVQMTFGRSVDPIVTAEHSITRMAVATEAEAAKQSGDNRTMGRKNTVHYGLYVAYGFVSSALAKQTGFNEDDLALFWRALENMFEHDHSAARGRMVAQKLFAFKHESALGNAPAHKLFELVNVRRKEVNAGPPARQFTDYEIHIAKDKLPQGVELIEKF